MTLRAEFRFYEELNDHLPEDRRKRPFIGRFTGRPTVGEAIQALGAPPAEVDLVLVNGESSGFERRLADGDRVSVYPVFESFDVSSLVRVRDKPLRRPAFLLDAGLEALAERMQRMGLDARCDEDPDDARLLDRAQSGGRTLLTTRNRLLDRDDLTHGYRVRATDPDAQLQEILGRFHLQETGS